MSTSNQLPNDITERKHGGNPESAKANVRASEKKNTWRTAIYTHLRLWAPKGKTCRELADHFHRPMHAISGRLSELKKLGMVVKLDERRNGGRVLVADVHAEKQGTLAL